jgi:hypothetical protein
MSTGLPPSEERITDGAKYDYCFMCGRSRMEVGVIIGGEQGGICFDCVALCEISIKAHEDNKKKQKGKR